VSNHSRLNKRSLDPALAILDDCLVAGHARKHGDDGQTEEGGERAMPALSPTRILKPLREFRQLELGIHAEVLIRRHSEIIHHAGWI
jgi:hypothetical protein